MQDDYLIYGREFFDYGAAEKAIKFISLIPSKIWGVLGPIPYGRAINESKQTIKYTYFALNIILMMLFYYGYLISFRNINSLLLFNLFYFQAIITAIFFYGNIRTRLQIIPFIILVSAYGVVNISKRIPKTVKQTKRRMKIPKKRTRKGRGNIR